ncbi:hypothetical protein Bca52824_094735 [Brassica carinata]|uniref:Uncharacterized protein n=1 Tax=Brassica carinata TaxID=52824 RepID=A0A8X7TJI4_BRACI|nr:hypothetical protein Bca52824_094735 [Brassica carinata]
MAWRSAGSAARSFVSATARARLSDLRRQRFRVSSLLPLHNVVASARLISHLNLNVRAFCELPNGTFQRTCPDR